MRSCIAPVRIIQAVASLLDVHEQLAQHVEEALAVERLGQELMSATFASVLMMYWYLLMASKFLVE